MNINWVLADNVVLDPTIEIRRLKDIGSLWGSWQTWRACSTDNVICHQAAKAQELIDKNFHTFCNFYIPNSLYIVLDPSPAVQVYEGNFVHKIDRQDELVAMHLAASRSDIVLLLGFDWTTNDLDESLINYRGMVAATVANNPDTQWVIVDQPGPLRPELAKLENLTTDTLANVLKLMAT
jgi:hypothetical protein